jgi:hypothetical protein
MTFRRAQDLLAGQYSKLSPAGWPRLLLSGLTLMVSVSLSGATPALNTEDPVGFFTNVASRLLSSELNVDLTRIPVYPTNQYTPAVHRLLQVTANIYDATTTNFYPSVFRPLFSRDASVLGTNIFISGYTNVSSVTGVGDERLGLPVEIGQLVATNITFSNLAVNVYGVPWIIGARKGFPSFNRFSFESVVGITRRLQVTRPSLNGFMPDFSQFKTNQMYTMSVSNYLGVEFWNSYASGYTGAVQIVTRDYLSMWLTNDFNGTAPTTPGYTNFPVINSWLNPSGATWGWAGWADNGSTISWPATNSFVIPLITDAVLLSESVYRFTQSPAFLPTGTDDISYFNYESNLLGSVGSQFPFPHFGLLTTNRLQAFMLDGTNIIDYVQFQQTGSRDINAEFFTDTDSRGVWYAATNPATGIPEAVLNQLRISRGFYDYENPPPQDGKWKADPLAIQQSHSANIPNEQAFFDAFFKPFNRTTDPVAATNTLLSVQAPYSPTRYVVQCTFMQANDPLVHYLASDLNQFSENRTANPPSVAPAYLTNLSGLFLNGVDFRQLTRNYQPWGGSPAYDYTGDTNQWNLAIKDPLVCSSDDWDFPTNQVLGIGWLGRVHRGTPWQTIFLKATNVLAETGSSGHAGADIWENWTGDLDAADAAALAPVGDWHLVSLLASLLNTNDLHALFSVNNRDPHAWQVLFDGLTVLTNDLPDNQITGWPQFDLLIVSSNSLQVSAISSAIEPARAAQPDGFFREVGDILTAPQLTDQSPFLNRSSNTQITRGISDEAYEIIPGQLLPLLRADSIGSIARISGQMVVQFTGYDGNTYVVQTSANLADWTNFSTNIPVNGLFDFKLPATPNPGSRFYRSILVQ